MNLKTVHSLKMSNEDNIDAFLMLADFLQDISIKLRAKELTPHQNLQIFGLYLNFLKNSSESHNDPGTISEFGDSQTTNDEILKYLFTGFWLHNDHGR